MQTFITSNNLTISAFSLDNKRLFKQFLEAVQILDGIVNNKDGWRNHPARKQWEKHPYGLFMYIFHIYVECGKRGIAKESDLWKKTFDLQKGIIIPSQDKIYPDWLYNEAIHSSHRSRLRCKGFIDAACVDIKRDLKLKSIDAWLKENFKLSKNQLKFKHLEKLKETQNVNFQTKSHYEQFGWVDDPSAEYVWPV